LINIIDPESDTPMMHPKTPVVILADCSGAGKDAFLQKLIVELKERGCRTGVIKYSACQMEIDQPGKDTWRHARAGADVVALAARDRLAVVRRSATVPELEEILNLVKGVDLIIVDGYEGDNDIAGRLIIPVEELLNLVRQPAPVEGVPFCALDEVPAVADLLIQRCSLPK
jgi:molybdopterin-guanine dinucleotide biosynthesis protein MobB